MASIINSTTTAGVTVTGDNSGSLQLATNNGTTAVTIDTSQNVGIGTTSPVYKLHVNTTFDHIHMTNPTTGTTGSDGFTLDAFGTSARLVQRESAPMEFYTAGTERMRITSDGDLLIGETGGTSKLSITQSSNSSTAMRIVYSGTGAFPIEAITSNASYSGAGIRSRVQNLAAGTGYYAFSYYNDNAADYRFLVLGNGNVQNTNNSYGALSDVKLKENIIDATPKLEKLNQVRVVSYNLKENPKQKLLGVVAQELEQIFPSMIEETLDRDAEGNVLDTTTKSVKYSVFVPMLIKAVQELNAKVEAQALEIQALKGVT